MYDGAIQYVVVTYEFTGKEHDSESGFDNFGARFDSSSLGRFMSPDAFYNDSSPGRSSELE